MAKERSNRKPIVVQFEGPVSDDLYLQTAAAIMTLVDLAGVATGAPPVTMSIDPALDDQYEAVDPFGPTRQELARKRPRT